MTTIILILDHGMVIVINRFDEDVNVDAAVYVGVNKIMAMMLMMLIWSADGDDGDGCFLFLWRMKQGDPKC